MRGQTDHSRWSVGRGAQRIAKVAELTSAGVSGSAAHGPAGLGTVCGPKGEEASRIARACVRARAVERTRLINRGCLGVRIGWGLNTRLDPGAGGSLICIILARDKGRPPALEDVICISPGEAVLQSAVISIWIGRGGHLKEAHACRRLQTSWWAGSLVPKLLKVWGRVHVPVT